MNKKDGGEIVLVMLGGRLPAVGPRLGSREEAVEVARHFVREIDDLLSASRSFQMLIVRRPNLRYTVLLRGNGRTLEILHDMDELLLWRFKKAFRRGFFVLTTFFQDEGDTECLAVAEGLGAVIFMPRLFS